MRVDQSKFGIPFRKYYFDRPRTKWQDLILPTAYMDAVTPEKPFGFLTEFRHTLLTDLRPDEEDIFRNFPKDTRNQIRRCERDQCFTLNLQTRLESFIPLYNAFATTRNMSLFDEADARNIGIDNFTIFSVDHQGQPIICHLYLVSPETGVTNLLISASSQMFKDDPDMRRAMAFANRCLHWQGMRHFKASGFHTYDWGGYVVDTDDPVMQGINRFKKTFNGKLTPIYNYYSPAYAFIEHVRQLLRK